MGSFKSLRNEEAIARSFEALGHEVVRVDESLHATEGVKLLEDGFYDIVLVAKLKCWNLWDRVQFLKRAKERGAITVCWTFDLYFGLTRQHQLSSEPIFKCDFVLSPDGGHDEEFRRLKINHHLLRQGIYHEFCYQGEPSGEDIDVLFVGCHNPSWPYRYELIQKLEKQFNVLWVGRDRKVYEHDLNRLYATAKVVIGDSVYSPFYWSNRIMETIGRGGFMIHPEIEGLDRDFVPYKEFVPYRFGDYAGLNEKIRYFLDRPSERMAIAGAGMERVKKDHTLLNRCQSLIDIVSK